MKKIFLTLLIIFLALSLSSCSKCVYFGNNNKINILIDASLEEVLNMLSHYDKDITNKVFKDNGDIKLNGKRTVKKLIKEHWDEIQNDYMIYNISNIDLKFIYMGVFKCRFLITCRIEDDMIEALSKGSSIGNAQEMMEIFVRTLFGSTDYENNLQSLYKSIDDKSITAVNTNNQAMDSHYAKEFMEKINSMEKKDKYLAIFLDEVYADETYTFFGGAEMVIIPGERADVSWNEVDRLKIDQLGMELSFPEKNTALVIYKKGYTSLIISISASLLVVFIFIVIWNTFFRNK